MAGRYSQFNEAISLQIYCDTQDEIDYYWDKLGEGGDPKAQQCGWLKDRFGVSWQVVPSGMEEFYKDENRRARSGRWKRCSDEEARHRGAQARLRR